MCKSMLLSCLAGYVPLAWLFLFSCLLVCLLLLPVLTVDCFEFVGCTYFSFGQDLPQQSRISTSIHRTHTHTHAQTNKLCMRRMLCANTTHFLLCYLLPSFVPLLRALSLSLLSASRLVAAVLHCCAAQQLKFAFCCYYCFCCCVLLCFVLHAFFCAFTMLLLLPLLFTFVLLLLPACLQFYCFRMFSLCLLLLLLYYVIVCC